MKLQKWMVGRCPNNCKIRESGWCRFIEVQDGNDLNYLLRSENPKGKQIGNVFMFDNGMFGVRHAFATKRGLPHRVGSTLISLIPPDMQRRYLAIKMGDLKIASDGLEKEDEIIQMLLKGLIPQNRLAIHRLIYYWFGKKESFDPLNLSFHIHHNDGCWVNNRISNLTCLWPGLHTMVEQGEITSPKAAKKIIKLAADRTDKLIQELYRFRKSLYNKKN